MEVLYWVLGVLAFILMLAVSIGLHEAGHMSVAKLFKLSVPKFFVGFGPTLWSKKSDKTEYGVKAIPLGGFVMIEDESQSESSAERQMLSYVSPWKRILVFLAGPAVNLVLGTVILIGVLLMYPTQYVTTTVDKVDVCTTTGKACGAYSSGLLSGDEIVSIDGIAINGDAEKISPSIAGKSTVDVVVSRNNSEILLNDVAVTDGRIGINLNLGERYISTSEAFGTLGTVMFRNVEALSTLPSKVPALFENIADDKKEGDVPSSVVAVGKTYGDISANTSLANDDKVKTLLVYSGMLNIGLGMINLFLPIMPLDGGRIFIAFMDWFRIGFSRLTRGKWKYTPVSMKMINTMTAVTASFVFSFMGLVIISDIVQIFRGQI